MPLAIGVALGIDSARYAFDTLRSVAPVSFHGARAARSMLALDRARLDSASERDKDIAAVLGFSPLEVLRALRRKP